MEKQGRMEPVQNLVPRDLLWSTITGVSRSSDGQPKGFCVSRPCAPPKRRPEGSQRPCGELSFIALLLEEMLVVLVWWDFGGFESASCIIPYMVCN